MKYLLFLIRLLLMVIYAIILLPSLLLIYLTVGLFGKKAAIKFIHHLTPSIGAVLRFITGVRVKIFNKEKLPKEPGYLLASNHLGYVELFSIVRAAPMAFVAKQEIARWPVFGTAVTAVGTVYVDRESGGMSETYIQRLTKALGNGFNFWFSPEKTTTDGTWLRPFSSALFVAANRAKRPVVPAVFVIKTLNGKPVPKHRRTEIAWALEDNGDNTPFFKHFIRFMSHGWMTMEMHILDPVVPDYDDTDIDQRRAFSNQIHDLMADELAKYEPEFDRERKFLNSEDEKGSKF